MKRVFWQTIFYLQIFLLTVQSNVAAGASGVGGMASDMMFSVGFMADFIYSTCLVLGASFLFATVIKYMEHRNNPLMVPISTVVFLLVAGIVLVALPFISLLSGNVVRYSLFR